MRVIRRVLLLIAALVPLLTLVHKNDLGRWDVNRSVMIAPDEFSYLLTTDALLHGGHISTQATLGIDAFYPPGYSLILAGWALAAGLTPFAAHLLNALLVCAATGVVYFFSRRLLVLLAESEHRRFEWSQETQAWMAFLVAGIFATNWHVLEGALFVLSEPAFMLVTFAWLALGLKWREWQLDWRKTLAVALLATLAWSIRGAGIVCMAVTVIYPCVGLLRAGMRREMAGMRKRVGPILLIVGLAVVYQVGITLASPNRSLASADAAANGYPAQLMNGITDRGALHFSKASDWPTLAWHVMDLGMSHAEDYAASFVPWFRDPPDMMVRIGISRLLGALGLLGFLRHLTRRHRATGFLDCYVVFYFGLYLIWPFNITRFWAPLLPVMLVYLVDAVREFSGVRVRFGGRELAAMLLGLLLVLNGEEIFLKLGFYQRRVNLVSDSLANAAEAVVKESPEAGKTVVAVAGKDEHFMFAWYLPRSKGGAVFLPRSPKAGEHVEQLLLREMGEMEAGSGKRLFAISYFTEIKYPEIFENMRKLDPRRVEGFELRKVYQSEIITTVWEVRRKGHASSLK